MTGFFEKWEKGTSSEVESAFNESMFALRRQDRILSEINRIGVDVSMMKTDSLRPYLALLERFYMELSVIYADKWVDSEEEIEMEIINPITKKKENQKVKVRTFTRPEELKFVEDSISSLTGKINTIEQAQKITEKEQFIFSQLKALELYLRRLKQRYGMGMKREQVIDDEERLDAALGI